MLTYKDIAIQAARSAGAILRNYFGKPLDIIVKDDGDEVSLADKESEREIIRLIEENFPEHNIYGEESGLIDRKSEFTWVTDPLDGSTNFLLSIPQFSVAIALLQGNEIILGVVYHPSLTVSQLF